MGAASAVQPHGRSHAPSSAPLFSVGIQGGFTGATMLATVYSDGRVSTVRQGAGRGKTVAETRVPLSLTAVTTVIQAARKSGALKIPKALQDRTFGADIPVLSFRLHTGRGVQAVHAMGSETDHVPGTEPFFPIWGLLYAIAGYPGQLR